jgi:hypothetical protein
LQARLRVRKASGIPCLIEGETKAKLGQILPREGETVASSLPSASLFDSLIAQVSSVHRNPLTKAAQAIGEASLEPFRRPVFPL